MPLCPAGHTSEDADYCDVCGARITASAAPSVPKPRPDITGPVGAAERCPDCGAERVPGDRFCEDCGWDYAAAARGASRGASVSAPRAGQSVVPDRPEPSKPKPAGGSSPSTPARDVTMPSLRLRSQPSSWEVEIIVDRAYFELATEDDEFDFPGDRPPRVVALTGEQIRIGRRSQARGLAPEIDLTSADPGISHLHAVLIAGPGGWQLVDPGSTNGTTLNGGTDPLTRNVPVPVGHGDRIHVGAWTTLTLRRR